MTTKVMSHMISSLKYVSTVHSYLAQDDDDAVTSVGIIGTNQQHGRKI